MKNRLKIGISQRRITDSKTLENRDGLDVRLIKLVWELGFVPVPLTSVICESREYLKVLNLDAFILSGGNDLGTISERDLFEDDILTYSINNNKPVLGICRGMQKINIFQGGILQKIDNHVATCHSISGPLFNNSIVQVNSYHNYGIISDGLGDDLKAIAYSNDGVIEAIRHSNYNWMGIMWHPERDIQITDINKNIIMEHFVGGVS